MPLLTDRTWKTKYTSDDGNLLTDFYLPALKCAVRYDRTTGYFSAHVLALAAQGIEGLVANGGRMRLIVGCTLDQPEIEAIEQGTRLRDAVAHRLADQPLEPPGQSTAFALELLAWMVANGHLEVKVAVPCDHDRRPITSKVLFHEKGGIIQDQADHRLAFSGGINETAQGWAHN